MIDVEFAEACKGQIAPTLIREAVQAVFDRPEREVSVRIGTDDEIRALNRDYSGIDKVTDVLAFPSGEGAPGDDPYIGDLIICLPQALRQAQTGGHRLEQEIQLLAVHGTLHLLGHDHDTPDRKERMWARQAEILRSLGNDLTPP